MSEKVQQKIEQAVTAILSSAAVDLVELSFGGHKNDVSIVVLADKPAGGIRIAQCAQLNTLIVEEMDRLLLLDPQGYSLEVSSPGLDRPLVTPKDFNRCLNQTAHFWLSERIEGRVEIEGMILSAGGQEVIVCLKNKKQVPVALGKIIKAVLVI